jgi:hypothetical protein
MRTCSVFTQWWGQFCSRPLSHNQHSWITTTRTSGDGALDNVSRLRSRSEAASLSFQVIKSVLVHPA